MLIILLCSLWDNQHHGAARKQHHFNSILNKQNQLQQIYDDRFSLSLSITLIHSYITDPTTVKTTTQWAKSTFSLLKRSDFTYYCCFNKTQYLVSYLFIWYRSTKFFFTCSWITGYRKETALNVPAANPSLFLLYSRDLAKQYFSTEFFLSNHYTEIRLCRTKHKINQCGWCRILEIICWVCVRACLCFIRRVVGGEWFTHCPC